MTLNGREGGVCAVVVTYADRASLCKRTVEAALAAGVTDIVVVDNGSQASSRAELALMGSRLGTRLVLRELDRNHGSAYGFLAGVVTALQKSSSPLIWLLDDDNVPDREALRELLAWRSTLTGSCGPQTALCSYRPARKYQREIVSGRSSTAAYPSPGSFLSFHLGDYGWRCVRRAISQVTDLRGRAKEARGTNRISPVEIPYGPYGGLLLPRTAIDAVGLPETSLVTYEDDAEYTRRLTTRGIRLFLVPSSRVQESDASWYVGARGRGAFSRLLSSAEHERLYYSIRNRVYFEQRYWRGRRLTRAINRRFFLSGLWLTAKAMRRQTTLAIVRRAITDGEAGLLGPRFLAAANNGVSGCHR